MSIEKIKLKSLEENNSLLMYCIDELLSIINGKKLVYILNNVDELYFTIELFDNDLLFYTGILNNYENYYLEKDEYIKTRLDSLPKMVIRNIYIYLNYLKYLINDKKVDNLYKNKSIKLDISTIFGFFLHGFNDKLIGFSEYFLLNVKELEKEYNILCKDFNTPFDKPWKDEAKTTIEDLKEQKNDYIENAIIATLNLYSKQNKFNSFDELSRKRKNFQDDKKILTIQELHEKYVEGCDYIDKYLDINFKGCSNSKKDLMKNYYFYSEILSINTDDVETSVLFLDFYNINNCFGNALNIDGEFKNYIEKFKLIDEAKKDYTHQIKEILDNKDFIEKLKSILKSNAVKTYLENKRKFFENSFNVELVQGEGDKYDDNLKNEYSYFIELFEKDVNFFNKLIVFKYLPKNMRAYVLPYMRIALNPLFIETSDSLEENIEIQKNILTSYLIIILIHEIIHLLKFFKREKIYFNTIPGTPLSKEGGKVFINYLFGVSIVNSLTYEQSQKINDINSWNDIDILRNIFLNEDKESSNKTIFYIKYYSSDYDFDLKEPSNDYWMDLD